MAYTKDELIKLYEDSKGKFPERRKYYGRVLKHRFGIDTKTLKPIEEPLEKTELKPITTENIEKTFTDWQDVLRFDKPCRIGIFGLQGGGKTTLAKEMAYNNFNSTLIFDIVGEYEGFHRYVTRSRSYPDVAIEFNQFYKNWYKPKVLSKGLTSILIIDEASRVAPQKRALNDGLAELNDLHRHYNNSFLVIARRPVQLHTDLMELLNYIICFKVTGMNDLERLRDINKSLEDAVISLRQYEYVIYDMSTGTIYYGATNM